MKPHATAINQRLLRGQTPSYERLQARLAEDGSELGADPIAVHCGWGRLLIGHTFPDPASLAQELLNEQPGERDIALYVAAPQQMLAGTDAAVSRSVRHLAPVVQRLPSGHPGISRLSHSPRKAKRTGKRSISCTRRAACCRSMPRADAAIGRPGVLAGRRRRQRRGDRQRHGPESSERPSTIRNTAAACGAWRSIRTARAPASAKCWCGT
jgi:hypothetical protein